MLPPKTELLNHPHYELNYYSTLISALKYQYNNKIQKIAVPTEQYFFITVENHGQHNLHTIILSASTINSS